MYNVNTTKDANAIESNIYVSVLVLFNFFRSVFILSATVCFGLPFEGILP